MTRRTNARLAGILFLAYIAVGVAQMLVARGATGGADMAARLASIAAHAPQLRLAMLLGLTTRFFAIGLAVTLWAITRDEDRELAMIGLCCRVGEALIDGFAPIATLGLVWLATTTGPGAPEPVSAQAIAAFLLKVRGAGSIIGATFFAVGSTIFCWLFLRGRLIPAALAWLGVLASLLLVVCLPAQLTGVLPAPLPDLMWLPMLAFEVPLGAWLIVKGVAEPDPRQVEAERRLA